MSEYNILAKKGHFLLLYVKFETCRIVANTHALHVKLAHFLPISRLPHAWFSFSRSSKMSRKALAWPYISEKKMRELISSDSTCLSCFCPRLVNWTPCCLSSSNDHLWLDSHGFKLKAKIHCAIRVLADYFKKLECNYYFLVQLHTK